MLLSILAAIPLSTSVVQGVSFALAAQNCSLYFNSEFGKGALTAPVDIASDDFGFLFVIDPNLAQVLKYTQTGIFVSAWGGSGGQFDHPWGVGTDSLGNVYVADTDNHRIQVFDGMGTHIRTVGAPGQFSYPRDVSVDSQGNIFVSDDFNYRILKFDSSWNLVTSWGTRGSGPSQFDYPTKIAIDRADNIFVLDYLNRRIQKFTNHGTFLTQWGSSGSGPGQFVQPHGIAVDMMDNVYVTDGGNNRIQKFDSSGMFLCEFGQLGSGPGQFSQPRGVSCNDRGRLFVADDANNDRVQIFLNSPSPPFILNVFPLPPISGQYATFTTLSGTPRSRTYFTYSTTGLGSTAVPKLGVTLGIRNPSPIGPPIPSDTVGTTIWSTPIPSASFGRTVWIQAMESGRVTDNIIATTIQ